MKYPARGLGQERIGRRSASLRDLPYLVYADEEGRIYDHPYLRMAGFVGSCPIPLREEDLVVMPEYSKLFFLPGCPPLGMDPATGEYQPMASVKLGGKRRPCQAVAAFLEPGMVRTHLPAADYSAKSFPLPTWAYTAVGFRQGRYWVAAFPIEYNHRWDPRNYDDRELVRAVDRYMERHSCGPLVKHLSRCATENHCFAAKNLFLERWEAPLPVSRACNADCIGCLSFQPDSSFQASHERISFRPSLEEIVEIAVSHLDGAPDAIVSFGQGCEGEPLTESELIADAVREIRKRTRRGTLNLNTNGSSPDRIRDIAQCGLDSIRISINSARASLYQAYYRPKTYDFEDVVESIGLSRRIGLYTMINYLIFPGVTDQEEELAALEDLLHKTGANFLHLKNLNIDPQLYLENLPRSDSMGLGIKTVVKILRQDFPGLELGYFNRVVR